MTNTLPHDFLLAHSELLLASYRQLLGTPLLPDAADADTPAQRLFNAPFALLSHGTEDDPIFNYANACALQLFELEFAELSTLPSRLSAEPALREEREQLLARVTQFGFIDNYQGIRISKSGRRFLIRNAIVWNLFDAQQVYRGQAACFHDWLYV